VATVFCPIARILARPGQVSVNQAQTKRYRPTGTDQQAQMNVYRHIHRLQDHEKIPKILKPLPLKRKQKDSEI
jgi:hypothetical protein